VVYPDQPWLCCHVGTIGQPLPGAKRTIR
jgi:hypothetical protein